MAKNIPVVAMNVGALPEILGKHGILCSTYDELVEKTILLLNNRQLAEKISHNSRQRVENV